MLPNRGEHSFVLVHEVPVRYAETLRKAVLPKYVLGDSPRRLGKCHSIAPLKSIIDTSLNESLPNSAPRKLAINRQHEHVKVFPRRNGPPSAELLLELLKHEKDRQKVRADLVLVQGWK